ncbi:aldehyde dehydrogenase family protein [Halegenticoccus tardaugens]|uniref:aldehyde dehydrogenase family protein n=1 Tax=Halegenticoccus tardaugens TaxID=2071624 RepID=UPI001E29E90B|nr:aldehyde dehydrogenase family protein [Halegenticoccus tardaugens]
MGNYHDLATGEPFTEITVGTEVDVGAAVAAARAAFESWRETPPHERGRIVHGIGELIAEHAAEHTAIESKGQGKPLSQVRSDVRAADRYFEYFAGWLTSLRDGASRGTTLGGLH